MDVQYIDQLSEVMQASGRPSPYHGYSTAGRIKRAPARTSDLANAYSYLLRCQDAFSHTLFSAQPWLTY